MNEEVLSKVQLPGTVLAAAGGATILSNMAYGAFSALSVAASLFAMLSADPVAALTNPATILSLAQVAIFPLVGMITGAVMIAGGMKLRSASGGGVVWAGAVMACLPCCSMYCCCFALPAGVWAIVTMMDEDVKAAFEQNG